MTDPAGADLRVTAAPTLPEGAVALAREPLAVAVSPRLPVREVTAEQVRGMLSGAIANWSEAGSPIPLPVVPLPRHRPGTPVTDVEALVTELGAQPGGLALAPLSAIDFRVGTLSIDGIDLVRHPERAAAYPFQLHLFAASVAPASPPAVELVAAPGPLPLPPSDPAVTVTMVGDIILGRTVHTIMTRLGDFAAPFRLVADELRGADLTVGNLECSLSDTIEPPADPYTFAFMTRAAGVEGLLLAGIDGVSLANNHSMNFGGAGMRDTLAALDRAGIRHFGGGADLAAAQAPAIFDLRGLRVAYLGFDGITGDVYGASADSPGTAPLRVDGLVAGIEAARQHADIVIPFIHWGVEYTLTPTDEQRALARRAIEAGASLVVGSHPHWVQGMEIHQGRPIVYSLGNFVFDQEWSPETKQGLIMHLVFHGTRLVALRFVPVLIEHYYRPRIVSGQEMTAILDRVWASTDALASNPLR
ncbi:MAG: CapA family protein [Sphaerobacter sp.]|nr:CapA family protein [Sphaerobacter sp.]